SSTCPAPPRPCETGTPAEVSKRYSAIRPTLETWACVLDQPHAMIIPTIMAAKRRARFVHVFIAFTFHRGGRWRLPGAESNSQADSLCCGSGTPDVTRTSHPATRSLSAQDTRPGERVVLKR